MIPVNRRAAFTLIELLVVVAIISVLIALLLPAIQKVREAAARVQCQNNMKQIGIALHNYHDTHKSFPYGFTTDDRYAIVFSWLALSLPYLEEANLFPPFRTLPHWTDPSYGTIMAANQALDDQFTATPVKAFLCPSCPLGSVGGRFYNSSTGGTKPAGLTNYVAIEAPDSFGKDGVIHGWNSITGCTPARQEDIKDGTSQTLMVGEHPPSPDLEFGMWGQWSQDSALGAFNTYWTYACSDKSNPTVSTPSADGNGVHIIPVDECNAPAYSCTSRFPAYFSPGHVGNYCDTDHFWSFHTGGSNWLYADGSVRFMSYQGGPLTKALATRAGGENVENPW